jgi:alpha-galactosidase
MITFNSKKGMFCLDTKDSSYIFGFNKDKRLYQAYYGSKLSVKQRTKSGEYIQREIGYHFCENKKSNFLPEINIYDGHNVFENTIKVSLSNGTRTLDCVYAGHKITNEEQHDVLPPQGQDKNRRGQKVSGPQNNVLEIMLQDRLYKIDVVLSYTVHYKHNLIEKSINIINREKEISLNLETFNSGDLMLPPGKYNLGYFHGGWIKEMSLRFEEISHGKKVIESRTGHSSHIHNPSFFITKDKKVSEDMGKYYYGQLMWGGSFRFVFEKRIYDAVGFSGGINSFDGNVIVGPGKQFKTPGLILGFSDEGTGKMSRDLHDFYRDKIMPQDNLKNIQRVLVNSWEALYFSINEEKLLKLADKARMIGAEILVVDDGWFRKRDKDDNSLGDWQPVKEKFPAGMEAFGEKVKARGLKFGIWLEPEAVNIDSELYRKHPDWVYNFPGRLRTTMRNTLVLNITKPEVKKFIKEMIHRVITEYKPDYVKWDMNRYISDAGAANIKDSTVWIEHMTAAYELMEYLKSLKPGIILEGCAGGGGRVSGGMFRYVDQMWASDNNDPFCRQFIQYGTSLFYPAQVMCCHVADSPYGLTGRYSTPMFRICTAMAGNFGTEANLIKWKARDIKLLGSQVKLYKEIRDIIYSGDLYRLENPYEGARVAFNYVSKDKNRAVLFVYLHKAPGGKLGRIVLKGLSSSKKYEVFIGGKKSTISGSVLMNKGVDAELNKIQDSQIVVIKGKYFEIKNC